ncbi:MAG: DUF1501 domain-containing protein [Rhodothermales bacterium]|nr:DUF1501 domain-containing protein [Rhodothermales bacterium]
MTTRRAFLKAGGLGVVALGLGGCPLFLNRAARAAAAPAPYRRRRVLVALFQRGAMDGLMAVSPFEDPHLRAARPRLALPATGPDALIDLDGRFGLHPALAPLHPFYDDGRLAIIHGVGSPDPTRSHFDAQDYMESGTPGVKGTASGWLNRAVGLTGHDATPFQAVALAPALPRALHGPAPALALADLDAATPAAGDLEALYRQTAETLLHEVGTDAFEAARVLEHVRQRNNRPAHGARYPASPLGARLRQIARLIRADVGLEVAFTETDGWDTHVQQGAVRGTFARRAGDLARSIHAFWTDLGPLADDVVLMTMTEFGRTVAENGSGGTDHGRASCLFLLGNAVAGRRVHGTVPALAPEHLEDRRDLPVTTDFRAVFASVAGAHLGIVADDVLFPGWHGTRKPLLRG